MSSNLWCPADSFRGCFMVLKFFTSCSFHFLYIIVSTFNGCDDPQDYYVSSRGSRTKPSFPICILRSGATPNISYLQWYYISYISKISSPLFLLIFSRFIQGGFNTSSPRFGEEVKSNSTVFNQVGKQTTMKEWCTPFSGFFQAVWMAQIPLIL